MHRVAALILFFAMAVSPAYASEELRISKIVEAGLVGCDDDMPENIGPRTYRNVKKLCEGRDDCSLTQKSARKFGCTSLFVQFKCSDGSDRELSASVNKTLLLKCE